MKKDIKKTLKEFTDINTKLTKFRLREMLSEDEFEDDGEAGGKLSPEFAEKVNDEIGDKTITNPDTGADIKVTSALGYDKGTKVYKDAKKQWDKAVEKVTGKEKSSSPDTPTEDPGKLSGDDFALDSETPQAEPQAEPQPEPQAPKKSRPPAPTPKAPEDKPKPQAYQKKQKGSMSSKAHQQYQQKTDNFLRSVGMDPNDEVEDGDGITYKQAVEQGIENYATELSQTQGKSVKTWSNVLRGKIATSDPETAGNVFKKIIPGLSRDSTKGFEDQEWDNDSKARAEKRKDVSTHPLVQDPAEMRYKTNSFASGIEGGMRSAEERSRFSAGQATPEDRQKWKSDRKKISNTITLASKIAKRYGNKYGEFGSDELDVVSSNGMRFGKSPKDALKSAQQMVDTYRNSRQTESYIPTDIKRLMESLDILPNNKLSNRLLERAGIRRKK